MMASGEQCCDEPKRKEPKLDEGQIGVSVDVSAEKRGSVNAPVFTGNTFTGPVTFSYSTAHGFECTNSEFAIALRVAKDAAKPEERRNPVIQEHCGQGTNTCTSRTGIRPQTGKIKHLFDRLGISNKLTAKNIDPKAKHSLHYHESCIEEELVPTFLQELIMMNYRARYICTTSLVNSVHPMDVQMAVFHGADVFLKQLMVTKLSQCQYALPLLVPDPFTPQIEFPLWTFREITKSWRKRSTNNELISQTQLIYRAQTPMVFFFRFGSLSSSKSQLMNSLINEKHDTFFHRHCPGSSRTRELMDGVVEIAWFCPSKNRDKFSECVAFCNLHGDAGDHEKQLKILTDMSSVNVVFKLDKNDISTAKIQDLYKDSKPLICVFTEKESALIETQNRLYEMGLKDRNESRVSEEISGAIKQCLSYKTFKLKDMSKHSDIRVDEEDDEDCRRGRAAAKQMMSLLEKKDLREIKESFLPHQSKLWHQWSQKNRELHRPRRDETDIDISRKHSKKTTHNQQHGSDINEFMKLFIKEISCDNPMYFLTCFRILLHEHTSPHLSALHHKFDEHSSNVFKLMTKHYKSEELRAEQTKLERISEEIEALVFGVEHIMREIGQIYESCESVKKNKKDLQVDFSSLPSLLAEMMISGSPLELMDGDAAYVPVIWISAVLDQLLQKLGDQRVFVLSVLGLQGSGTSTMLNAMFGPQFVVGPGRTSRGAFMQLVRVSDEMKIMMNTDYILVVNTEGLRAHHDNELATFVVCLGNLTLINIFGQNLSEMKEILRIVVRFLMRTKGKWNPSCKFVHQKVSAEDRKMEKRRRLLEKLNKMTRLTAQEEKCNAECFSDVIRFDVQKDVKYIAQLWGESTLMAPPNPDYREDIQELKTTVLSHASKSDGMRLKDFKCHINDIWEALQSKAVENDVNH